MHGVNDAVTVAVVLQAGDSKKGNFKIMLMDNKPLGSIAKLLSASNVNQDQVEVRRHEVLLDCVSSDQAWTVSAATRHSRS